MYDTIDAAAFHEDRQTGKRRRAAKIVADKVLVRAFSKLTPPHDPTDRPAHRRRGELEAMQQREFRAGERLRRGLEGAGLDAGHRQHSPRVSHLFFDFADKAYDSRILIAVFSTVTTPVRFMLLARAALYRSSVASGTTPDRTSPSPP